MEIVIALVVLVLPTLPVLRLCANRSFIRGFPLVFGYLVLALAVYSAGILAFLILRPDWAIPAAGLAIVAILLERWRARADYGLERRLPPGSLSLFPVDTLIDHLALLKRAAVHGPVFKMTGSLRRAGMSGWPAPMVCIVGLERAHELLVRQHAKLNSPGNAFDRLIPRGFLRYMEPADHQVYRPIFQAVISPKIVNAEGLFIAEQIQHCLREMECGSTRGGILPLQNISKMIFMIWVGLFFGISPSSQDAARLEHLLRNLDVERTGIVARWQAKEALTAIIAILCANVQRWDSLTPPRCYLAELVALYPNALADPTLAPNFVYMMHTSGKDVASLMLWILKKLGECPEWLARVRGEMEPSGRLAECIVRETCRLAQSEYLIRRAREDIDFGGYHIPKDWQIRVCVRESHLDPAVFDDPFSFNPNRFLERDYSRAEYAPFGMGHHSCLGSQLTLSIAKNFITELASGFDLQVTADGAREFRRFHWQPSSRFRVRLVARA